MAEVKIQTATIENLKDIQNLNHELCKKENKEFDSTINSNWSLSKEGEEYFREKIRDGCVFVAIMDGKIIGYLVGGLAEKENYRNISEIAELEDMFVLEDYRNLGTGTKLYQAFIDWCKSENIKRIKVVISAQNIKAINFYKKNGFLDYDVTLEADI